MKQMMRRFARWHIWLGWLIAVPLLLWTFTGLWMVARPIEEVRGTALRAEAAALSRDLRPVLPIGGGDAVEQLELVQRADRPVWIIHHVDGALHAVDARTGARLPAVDAALARRIATRALVRPAVISRVVAFAADAAPLDLRRERPSWQVSYADGVRVYVDQISGEVLAVRTGQWRLYDIMWGLHIMDLQGREDTHHPLLIGFAGLAFGGTLLGTVLLFRRRKARISFTTGRVTGSMLARRGAGGSRP
jgi:hypothetical protein